MRCILLHPHPDLAGNQHNSVIAALFAALEDAVRFDFASADPEVATRQVVAQLENGSAWLVGYSFGGGIASLVDDPRVLGWCLVAPALAMTEPLIGPDKRPKHVLAAEEDQFFSPAMLQAATADWRETTHDVVAGADHFLRGHETDVAQRCVAWLTAAGGGEPRAAGVPADRSN
jgi:alpha/beta superfamily hydrolase